MVLNQVIDTFAQSIDELKTTSLIEQIALARWPASCTCPSKSIQKE